MAGKRVASLMTRTEYLELAITQASDGDVRLHIGVEDNESKFDTTITVSAVEWKSFLEALTKNE